MSERGNNREWLLKGAAERPDGWEADMIDLFGIEGSLDLLSAQGYDPWGIDLRHTPFAGNDELKGLVRNARDALHELARAAHVIAWHRIEERRSSPRLGG